MEKAQADVSVEFENSIRMKPALGESISQRTVGVLKGFVQQFRVIIFGNTDMPTERLIQ